MQGMGKLMGEEAIAWGAAADEDEKHVADSQYFLE